MATSADVRLVIATPVTIYQPDGRIERRQITCAEPSPDVAKAVAEAFGGSGTFSFTGKTPKLPVQGSADATGAATRGYAEAVAQMTERIATVQLLRDGQYRACEAYANGAIDESTYAIMVSRYDDTMITMLTADLIAGDFGRQLAAITSTATATAQADLKRDQREELAKAEKAVADAEQDVTEEQADVDGAKDRLNDATGDGDTSGEEVSKLQDDVAKQEKELEHAKSDEKAAETKLGIVQKSIASSTAGTTIQPVGALTRPGDEALKEVAKQLGAVQLNYLKKSDSDALMVRCLTAHKGDPVSEPCLELVRFLKEDHEHHQKATHSYGSILEKLLVGDYRKEPEPVTARSQTPQRRGASPGAPAPHD